MESSPSREQIVVVVARERSQQFSEAGANQCTQHKVAGSVLTGANGRKEPHPTPQFTIAENGEVLMSLSISSTSN